MIFDHYKNKNKYKYKDKNKNKNGDPTESVVSFVCW